MLLSAAQFACCLTASMYAALQDQLPETTAIIARRFFHAWLVLATVADIAITTVMAIKLFSARTGVRSTDRAINKLLYVTIPGGAVVSVAQLAVLYCSADLCLPSDGRGDAGNSCHPTRIHRLEPLPDPRHLPHQILLQQCLGLPESSCKQRQRIWTPHDAHWLQH